MQLLTKYYFINHVNLLCFIYPNVTYMFAYIKTHTPNTLCEDLKINHKAVSLVIDETDRVNVTQKIIREVQE